MLPASSAFSPIRRVLYATDFGERSRAALPYAAGLARAYGAQLYVAHIVEVAPWETCPELTLQQRIDATRQLDWILRSPAVVDVEAQAIVRHGGVGAEILSIVQKNRVDLLVTGSGATRGLRRLLLGPIAAKLARCAPCPVLTVGPRAYPRIGNAVWMRRIVYASEFNPASATALSYAVAFARHHLARLTVVHTIRESMHDEVFLASAKAWLRKMAPRADVIVEVGVLRDAAVRLSFQLDADLIMLGPGTAQLAQHVVRHAPCAVMTTRPVLEMAPRFNGSACGTKFDNC